MFAWVRVCMCECACVYVCIFVRGRACVYACACVGRHNMNKYGMGKLEIPEAGSLENDLSLLYCSFI